MLNVVRKTQLNKLAEDILDLFTFEKAIYPEEIADKNDINYYYDYYPDDFDGLQIYDGEEFHTHINLNEVVSPDSNRARFTFAHELGHFFIEEHHRELKKGYHPSKFDPKETNQIELEANYFAAALLMPSKLYRDICFRKPLSLDLIEELSSFFQTSQLATILRFVEIGTFPLMVAYSKSGLLDWVSRSNDFPYKAYKTKIKQALPSSTVIGEYFRLGEPAKHTGVERVYADDWFYCDDDIELNEQCFYSDYGYVISLIWPD
jgi:Zn-dependent peptidase ImmA (M78 family)